MKHLKTFKMFEDGAGAANATTAGMGAVSSAQPSSTPGDVAGGTEGSGDIGFGLPVEKKRKKGDATEVSDMRDLDDNAKIGDFPVEEVDE